MTRGGDILNLGSSRPLGARVEGDNTVFRLFAPRASKVTAAIFRSLDDATPKSLTLARCDDGIWEAVQPGNLHGWYYHYHVHSRDKRFPSKFDRSFKILDPYAFAAVGPEGPGIIWGLDDTEPARDRFTPPCWHDLVIVEAHVRDLTKHAPIPLSTEERLGFTGLKKWIETQGSYLKSLGVNAVELQPIQEFGDSYAKQVYHWGYMPVNYFAPDSSYALHPERGSQIKEFRDLIAAFHRQGLAVIVDVVYNHFGEPNHLLFIDRHYYFRHDEKGRLTNWSGCGNDLRCDTPMGKRLIIDSLKHLVEVYDVDGFRFDLAELIGIEVLRDIEAELKKVKPSVILIAEPWSFRGHIALDLKSTGFGYWNDGYRDFICDYVLGRGNQEGLRYFMGASLGHLTAWPAQTINYVESHDDHCWIDKITENSENDGARPTHTDRRRSHLVLAILMTSLGIPMVSAGQDMLRSKRGVHNSYQHGDINALDYQRALSYPGTHDYFRRWIQFRLSDRGRAFRLDSPPQESFFRFFGAKRNSAAALVFNADKSRGLKRLLFAVNPHAGTTDVPIHDLKLDDWTQIADHERFEEAGLQSARFRLQDGALVLPPLSCGLWEEDT